ncbi:related to Protein ECM3 [Hanseniaspora guilliermondii]|uniref:Related to Protein ECM3 n=1 Tax=Hanseniaspora guilliermondii TaxID=56406 RepID=A0A1L0D1S1_9ASCO|nr:related to Protein ECM3 [Hanseniaspora guilliermondii]
MNSFLTTTNEVIGHFLEKDNLYTLFINSNNAIGPLLNARDGSVKEASLSLIIYSCVKPIFKIYLIIGTGYLLSKLNILTGQGIKIISQVVLSVLLPSLSFSKIVTNIEDSLIKEVGICMLSAVVLFALGGGCGIAANIICKIPKQWRYGSICACIFPNISDLPIAYLQNMQSVFDEEQINQGVSFVIIFLVAFMLAVFNLGGFKLVEYDFIAQNKLIESKKADLEQGDNDISNIEMRDYDHSENSSGNDNNGKQSSPEQPSDTHSLVSSESQEANALDSVSDYDDISINHGKARKPSILSSTQPQVYREDTNNVQRSKSRRMSILSNQESLQNQIINLSKQKSLVQDFAQTDKDGNPVPNDPVLRFMKYNSKKLAADGDLNEDLQKWASFHSKQGSESINELTHENYPHTDGNVLNDDASNIASNLNLNPEETTASRIARMVTTDTQITSKDIDNAGKGLVSDRIRNIKGMKLVIFFIENCMRPCPLSVIIALIIAFIPWLKALFVSTNVSMANAPDNLPPLSFIMDYASYVGAASVPFGLLLLGATLGSLDIKTLPKGFITAVIFMLVARQVFMPVIGILWCNRIAESGWLDMTSGLSKVLLFVICIDFGLPSMTTMIYLTSGYTPIDAEETLQMDCVSFFLMVQYPLLIINLPFMASYYLKVQLHL